MGFRDVASDFSLETPIVQLQIGRLFGHTSVHILDTLDLKFASISTDSSHNTRLSTTLKPALTCPLGLYSIKQTVKQRTRPS